MALIDELQKKRVSLSDFKSLTVLILGYLPNVISHTEVFKQYLIHQSNIAGTQKFVRPINSDLFLSDVAIFSTSFDEFSKLLLEISNGKRNLSDYEESLINKTAYTIQQAIGAGFDLLSKPNSARKHVGNRFEELTRSIFSEAGIANHRTILKIPYPAESGAKYYSSENDIILSPFQKVRSNSTKIDPAEVIVSVKTSSKDRMGKMFLDKMLLEGFTNQPLKIIGIFQNDVQRKEEKNISFTLVSGLFLVYSNFLTELSGVYYLDLPPIAEKEPYNQYIKPFSKLLSTDIWRLFGS